MFKIIQKHLDTSLIRLSLIFAFIFNLLFNSAVFIDKFSYYQPGVIKTLTQLGKDFICIYMVMFIFFFGLTIHRLVFIIGTVFLFLTSALASYYLYFFHLPSTQQTLNGFFLTDINKMYEAIGIRLLVWIAFSLFVCITTFKHFGVSNTRLLLSRLLSALCILITINNIISPQYEILKDYFPIQYLHNSYLYFFGNDI